MYQLAIERTENCVSSVEDVRRACAVDAPGEDPRDLCNGHDLVAAVAVSSQWWAQSRVGSRELTTFIAAGLRCDVLEQLGWYEELKKWATARGRKIWNCAD